LTKISGAQPSTRTPGLGLAGSDGADASDPPDRLDVRVTMRSDVHVNMRSDVHVNMQNGESPCFGRDGPHKGGDNSI
jgi:hypothetical protein